MSSPKPVPAKSTTLSPSCPVESPGGAEGEDPRILLAHGEGGRWMRKLLRERIAPHLGNDIHADAVALAVNPGDQPGPLAVTTDSFVVSPLFFPGGDIGSLAVYGTINDLAVAGAEPLCLTLGLILEEGLRLTELDCVLSSVASAAKRCGVAIVAGDTKVVPRGAADRLFINTTGVGRFRMQPPPRGERLQSGDVLIVSGPIGKHGIAVLSARENLEFDPPPQSDSAPLHTACQALQAELAGELRAMRDATRGGVSAVLHEWAEVSGQTMQLQESQIPVPADVRGACELLGLDPLYVANEGTMVVAVAAAAAERALAVLRGISETGGAQMIGHVRPRTTAPVLIERLLGVLHVVDEPAGAPLPRIC